MTDISLRAPAPAARGTAVRDASVALFASMALCLGLALRAELSVVTAFGAVLGVALVAGAGGSVVARDARWSGPADRVTLVRSVLIGGCVSMALPVVAGELAARSWLLVSLILPGLILDAVDGYVARRTRTASPAGARLDMELDAALLLVCSVAAVRSLGWWVLAIGAMRYAYLVGSLLRPRLSMPLPPSRFRRVVAGLQGVALAVGLAPVAPLGWGRGLCAAALGLLLVSFTGQVLQVERSAR